MKKVVVSLLALCLLVACSKNDSPSKEEQTVERLMANSWVSYRVAYYTLSDKKTQYDYRTENWAFTPNSFKVTSETPGAGYSKEDYYIRGDSLFTNRGASHISFAGDSCILISRVVEGSKGNFYKTIGVLYPKY